MRWWYQRALERKEKNEKKPTFVSTLGWVVRIYFFLNAVLSHLFFSQTEATPVSAVGHCVVEKRTASLSVCDTETGLKSEQQQCILEECFYLQSVIPGPTGERED